MAKPKLLYLCHRIPYPPNKGDKIRSFNILKALSEQFDVYLGCFVDDPFDHQYESRLSQWCVQYKCVRQNKTTCKIKGLTSFFTNKPITLPYYADPELQQWVDVTLEQQKIDQVFIFSSAMAQYVDGPHYNHLHRVIDFVDIDSDKWRQYAENKTGIMRFVYHREYTKLAQYEHHYCHQFAASLFVSADEAAMFQRLMPSQLHSKIHPLLNGVDTDFFDPKAPLQPAEFPLQSPYLVFTGAMDYWANVDAVVWFVQHVWPFIKAKQPQLQLYIVGGNPTADVLALAANDIHVTGRVHDVRPYIAHANAVVAPLRIARGIQNKVLEAMAMDKPIIATSMAIEGINAPSSACLRIADSGSEFAEHCHDIVAASALAIDNRAWVIEHFTWQATLQPLAGFLATPIADELTCS